MGKREKLLAGSDAGVDTDGLNSLVRLLARAAAAEYVDGRAAGVTTPQEHGRVDR